MHRLANSCWILGLTVLLTSVVGCGEKDGPYPDQALVKKSLKDMTFRVDDDKEVTIDPDNVSAFIIVDATSGKEQFSGASRVQFNYDDNGTVYRLNGTLAYEFLPSSGEIMIPSFEADSVQEVE